MKFTIAILAIVISLHSTEAVLGDGVFSLPPVCHVTQCGVGNTCGDNGECVCAGGLSNPNFQCVEDDGTTNCGLGDSDGGVACDTTNTVGGADVCTTTDKCHCMPDYMGRRCDEPRFELGCTAGSEITVTLRPYGYNDADNTPFNGYLYFSAENDFTEERLNNFPSGCRFDSEVVGLRFHAGYADCPIDTSIVNGEANLYAYLQHDKRYRTGVDQVISMRCFDGIVASSADVDFTIDPLNLRDRAPVESTVAENAAGYTMSLKKQVSANTWADLTDAVVAVGQDMSLFVEHASDDFSLKSCWATNRVTGDGYEDKQQLYFLEDWCVPSTSAGVMNSPVAGASAVDANFGNTLAKAMRIDFDAFYFPGQSRILAVECLICHGGTACDTNAAVVTCDNDLSSKTIQDALVSRRRRQADFVSGAINSTLVVSIYVGERTDGSDNNNNDDQTSSSNVIVRDCYKSTSVLLPIILLAALLLVTMVMTFFFCMKVTRSQDALQTMGHENMSYKS